MAAEGAGGDAGVALEVLAEEVGGGIAALTRDLEERPIGGGEKAAGFFQANTTEEAEDGLAGVFFEEAGEVFGTETNAPREVGKAETPGEVLDDVLADMLDGAGGRMGGGVGGSEVRGPGTVLKVIGNKGHAEGTNLPAGRGVVTLHETDDFVALQRVIAPIGGGEEMKTGEELPDGTEELGLRLAQAGGISLGTKLDDEGMEAGVAVAAHAAVAQGAAAF